MTFENQNPAYYIGDRTKPWDAPNELALLGTLVNELVQLATTSGGFVSQTLNLVAKIGVPGQVLGETIEVIIQTDGNVIQFWDGTFWVEQSTEVSVGVLTSTFLPWVRFCLG